jgi:hypothetical protein
MTSLPGCFLRSDATFCLPWGDPLCSAGLAPFFHGMIGGLTMSNDATLPNTTLDITAGVCTSDDFSQIMQTPAMTKTTAAWAVGTGVGALDTGTIAPSTWYHVFVMERIDTWTCDLLFSASAAAPTLPAPYTKKRRIGSFLTDVSANIVSFIQFGDAFLWLTPVPNETGVSVGTSPHLTTLTVPNGVNVFGKFLVGYSEEAATQSGIFIYCPDIGPQTCAVGQISMMSNGVNKYIAQAFEERTNVSGQIATVSTSNLLTNSMWITATGWEDNRGRFN